MRRLLSTLVLASLVLMFFCGCEKEGVRKVKVEMTPFNGGKLVIDNYSLNWSEGDEIAVQGGVYAVEISSVSLDIEDETLYALYPASAKKGYADGVYNVEIPRVQTYQVENGKQVIHPLMAAKGTNSLFFKHVCSLLKVQVPEITDMTVQYIDITTVDGATPLSGEGQVTVTGETPTFAFSSDNIYPYVRLDCGEGVSGTVFYIVVPQIDSKKLKVTLTVKSGSNRYRHAVSQSRDASLPSGWCGFVTIPTFELTAAEDITAPTNALCEYFSMSETTKVFFSKGNLQYKTLAGSWKFSDKQYTIIGTGNQNINLDNQWIDLFGWATSGIGCNKPNTYTTTNSDYCIRSHTDNQMSIDCDWGANNIVGTTGWRTPLAEEWRYLIEHHRKTYANIENVNGIIILPDYWILPDGCSFIADCNNYSNNTYTIEEWNKMERYGALFLPAAGCRSGRIVTSASSGYYWSSDFDEEDITYEKACVLKFSKSNSLGITTQDRFIGSSVRLVKNK